MATSVLAVLSLVTVAVFGTAMVHGSTTTLEITASDKDTGSWVAKMGDTKVAVEHKHLEGNAGSGEWSLKLSQSSDFDENNDISEDKKLQQRDTPMEDSPEQPMGAQTMSQQDSYNLSPAAGVPGPSTWEFQQRTLPETLTPPGGYQDTSYLPTRLESPPAPDAILQPPPALPPYSYNMVSRQAQPLLYPNPPSFAPNRIQRGFMSSPLQPYNTLRYDSEFPAYNFPSSGPTFEANNLERTFINDIIQPNGVQQSYLPLWQSPESHVTSVAQQQDSYAPGAFAGQQNYFPRSEQRQPEPINTYQYTAVIIPNAEEPSPVDQNTGKSEYSSEVPNRMYNRPDPGMLQPMQNQHVDAGMPFLYASNSMLDSHNIAPQEETQTAAETNNKTPNSLPEQSPDSGYASDVNTEQKYVIVEALVLSNPETAPAQELSRGENVDQPLTYSPNFAHRAYNEDIEGLKVPQPLPLFVDERMQNSPKLISDYSAPSYGMTPPSRTEERHPNENEVVPEYKEIQDYHPYIADIAFRPIQEADRTISYMPTSVIKEEETAETDTTMPDIAPSSEMQK